MKIFKGVEMDIRKGFDRLSKALLALIWVVFTTIAIRGGSLAHFGESMAYLLIFTAAYIAFCKLVAWVYNGFAGL